MSEAKRDQSEFRFTVLTSPAAHPPRACSAGAPPPLVLELLDTPKPWLESAAAGNDPYNTLGNRAARARR